MALALIVLGARTVIWGRQRARLSVNGDRIIESELGVKLLDALNQSGIHLPTSCSGAGTCGLCRVQVSGTKDDGALPIERAQISRDDIADGYRLACQLVVRNDFEITVPPELLGAEHWQCRVKETRNLSPLIKEIVLELPKGIERSFDAGSYVLIDAPTFKLSYADIKIDHEFEPEWDRLGLRRIKAQSYIEQTRAYSTVNRPDVTDTITLNIRLALPPILEPNAPPGIVSSYLFGLRVGDMVSASGPYGSFFVQDTDREMIFIGGGVGMAPLYAHTYDQLVHVSTQRSIQYWYGARTMADLYYTDEMEALAAKFDNFSWHPVLSEPNPQGPWDGETGFVHVAIYQHYLRTHPAPQNCEYYLCGPPLMIQAVRVMLDELDVPQNQIFSDDFGV